jgi:hypothetical protein
MIQFMGFPNGTDDAKRLRAVDGSKTACDFEFDFHGAYQAFSGIVIEGDTPIDEESPDFGFKVTQSNE